MSKPVIKKISELKPLDIFSWGGDISSLRFEVVSSKLDSVPGFWVLEYRKEGSNKVRREAGKSGELVNFYPESKGVLPNWPPVLTYPQVIELVALNDDPKNQDAEDVAGTISVGFVADIFGRPPLEVAQAIVHYRKINKV